MKNKAAIVGLGFTVAALLAMLFGVAKQPVRPLETAGLPHVSSEDLLPADRPFPQPVDDLYLGLGAKTDNKLRRKAWFAERHRAAPGTDWKAIERANGLAQMRKRNELARLAAQGVPPAGAEPRAGFIQWAERGSENQSGRMHVARLSSDRSLIYAGSSLGGVWVGELDGTDWYPIGDNLFGGAHELAVLPPDSPDGPDVVLAVTDGGRIHRSADDGQTWVVPEGVGEPTGCRRVLTTTDGSHTVFAVLRYGDDASLLRSTDRAQSFELVYDLGQYRGDAWAPRDGGAGLYLLAGNALHRSDDNGDSWIEVGSLGVDGVAGELVGSEAGAPRLWAIVRVGNQRDLYRSDDAGASWAHVNDVHDYWRSLNASIEEVDVFAWGGVEVYRTTDAGQNFEITNSWVDYYDDPDIRLHADVPGIDVMLDVDGDEIWYVSTDGGLYRSLDRLATVENLSLNGLRVSQYYSTLTSNVDPTQVAAGSQDQGFQVTTFLEQDDQLFELDQLVSGDYGHLTSHDGSHDWVYTTYPGFLMCYWGIHDYPVIFSIEFPPDERHAWLPPIAADPLVKEAFFFPATRLYRYERLDAEWEPEIWSDLDVSEADEDEYISAIEFSPLDPQRAYLATNRGRVFHSDDRAVTWTESQSPGPNPHYFYGTALVASSSDVDAVWIGGSGYDGPAVLVSDDGAETFEPFDEGLPDTLVYCLAEAGDEGGGLYAGTETAAYRRDPGWEEWVDITSNAAPVTIYWSVEAVPAEGVMRFGTYGRGIWDYRIVPTDIGWNDAGPDEEVDGGVPAADVGLRAISGACTCASAPGRSDDSSPVGLWLLLCLLALAVLRSR